MGYVSVSPGLGAIDFSSRTLAPVAPVAPVAPAPRVTLPVRLPAVVRAPIVRAPLPSAAPASTPPTPPPDVQLPVGPPEAERREKEAKKRTMIFGGIALAGVVAFLLMRRK